MVCCRQTVLITALIAVITAAPFNANSQTAPIKENDVQAEELLQKAAEKFNEASAFSGTVTTTNRFPATNAAPACETRFVRTFRLQKPAIIFQEAVTQKKDVQGEWQTKSTMQFNSDNKRDHAFYGPSKTGRKPPVTPDTGAQAAELDFPEFFNLSESDAAQARATIGKSNAIRLNIAADETFADVPCTVVKKTMWVASVKTGTASLQTTKIYVGKKDGILRGYHTEEPSYQGEGVRRTSDVVLTNVVLGAPSPAPATHK